MKSNGYLLWYINKEIRLFFNKQHKSTESSNSNCARDKNCDHLGATTTEQEIFLLLRLPYPGKVLFQIEKKFENSKLKNFPENFALVSFTTLTILAITLNLKKVKYS